MPRRLCGGFCVLGRFLISSFAANIRSAITSLIFVCLENKLIIEVDGGQHGERAKEDEIRTQNLLIAGFRVLRFWNNEVLQEIEAVKERIWRAIEEGQPHPLSRPPLEGEGV